MKILIILMSFLFAHSSQENTCKLDITDLVLNAMKIGEREFDKDFTGQLYQKKVGRYTILLLTTRFIMISFLGQFLGFQWQMIHVNSL